VPYPNQRAILPNLLKCAGACGFSVCKSTKLAVNRLLVVTKKLTTVNRYPALERSSNSKKEKKMSRPNAHSRTQSHQRRTKFVGSESNFDLRCIDKNA
jgi:hypothetical protein